MYFIAIRASVRNYRIRSQIKFANFIDVTFSKKDLRKISRAHPSTPVYVGRISNFPNQGLFENFGTLVPLRMLFKKFWKVGGMFRVFVFQKHCNRELVKKRMENTEIFAQFGFLFGFTLDVKSTIFRLVENYNQESVSVKKFSYFQHQHVDL